jgi:UV DNA damage repair endonuclease
LVATSSDQSLANLSVIQLTFGSQGTGFRVKYQIGATKMSSLLFSFNARAKAQGWNVISSTYSSQFGLLEVSNQKYNMRVTISQETVGGNMEITCPLWTGIVSCKF